MADCFYDTDGVGVISGYVCFSLAAAAKNAEMISQLWLEKQHIKQEILCTNKTKEE